MAAQYEGFTDSAGKYRFRLKAANGDVMVRGEAYESPSGVKEGCEAMRRAAAEATVGDVS
jgi:hypothetical protein